MWRSKQRPQRRLRALTADQVLEAGKVASVLIVAGVAAYVSYWHIHDLALDLGEGPVQAKAIPLSVDGMMLAATLGGVRRRKRGLSVGWGSWLAELLGVGVSTLANIAAAEPTPEARVFAMWPPVALFVSLGLLFSDAHGPERRAKPKPGFWSRRARQKPAPDAGKPTPPPTPEPPPDSRSPEPKRVNGHRPDRVEQLLPLARQVVAANDGKVPGRKALNTAIVQRGGKSSGTETLRSLQDRLGAEVEDVGQ
jgi:hypothetical protein